MMTAAPGRGGSRAKDKDYTRSEVIVRLHGLSRLLLMPLFKLPIHVSYVLYLSVFTGSLVDPVFRNPPPP
jgi:hypothetical protein